jgi:hypothetical protein
MIAIGASDFAFETDPESLEYLRLVVESMMRLFGITSAECIGRINQRWAHVSAVKGEFDEIYREQPGYWAQEFMYGHAALWWITGTDRVKKGLPPLNPLPYADKRDA